MLTCLALLATVSLADIPALASRVETEARAINAQQTVTPSLIRDLETFSADSQRLSDSLRAAGVTQDMPCIFHGISEDAQDHIEALRAADTDIERRDAMSDLKVLLDDAILLAPMAAGAAADARAQATASTTD